VPVTLLVAGTTCALVMVISPVNDACNDFSTLAEMTRLPCQCFLPDATRCAEARLPHQSGWLSFVCIALQPVCCRWMVGSRYTIVSELSAWMLFPDHPIVRMDEMSVGQR